MAENATCNLCGSSDAEEQPKWMSLLRLPQPYAIQSCTLCGFVYLSPRPTVKEIEHLYATDPFWTFESVRTFPSRAAFAQRRFRRLEQWKPTPGALLGIGCLDGGHDFAEGRRRGWDVVAIEPAPGPLAYARDMLHLDVRATPAWDLTEVADRRFDAILSNVVEHLHDPLATLVRCRELLEPSGVALIEVPNQFLSIKTKARELAYDVVGENLFRLLPSEVSPYFHLSFFDPTTLPRLFARAGFEIVALRHYLAFHPVYRANPFWRAAQECAHIVGGAFERGPSMEVIARPAPAAS